MSSHPRPLTTREASNANSLSLALEPCVCRVVVRLREHNLRKVGLHPLHASARAWEDVCKGSEKMSVTPRNGSVEAPEKMSVTPRTRTEKVSIKDQVHFEMQVRTARGCVLIYHLAVFAQHLYAFVAQDAVFDRQIGTKVLCKTEPVIFIPDPLRFIPEEVILLVIVVVLLAKEDCTGANEVAL